MFRLSTTPSSVAKRFQLLPYDRSVCGGDEKKRVHRKRQRHPNALGLCKMVPGHMCEFLSRFLDYVGEVAKLASGEAETRVCDTLLELFQVLSVLGRDVASLVKCYFSFVRRAFVKRL
ncbi:unnamed protein product, partial [Iphiclides podalirius]